MRLRKIEWNKNIYLPSQLARPRLIPSNEFPKIKVQHFKKRNETFENKQLLKILLFRYNYFSILLLTCK
jgi:hypothetical protein